MKKFLWLLVFLQIFFFVCVAFAQGVKIIDLKGNVEVKTKTGANWQTAKAGMILGKNAELTTQKNSECTLAFDEYLSNVLTVKENSNLKIESLLPAKVYLPSGRVFALIEDVKEVRDFKVRTPVVIAGVLGTGEGVDSSDKGSEVSCFEGSLNVQGLDAQGNPTGSQELDTGSGIEVGMDGSLGERFGLPPDAMAEWNEVRGDISNTREQQGVEDTGAGAGGEIGGGSVQELKQEQQDTTFDQDFFQERIEREEGSGDPGNGMAS